MQKILIVEDDTNINNLLQEALSKEGYSCEQAFSGTEAKLLLNMQEHGYELVLLDLMLPGISGEAVLEEIRKKGITRLEDLQPLQNGLYLWRGDITTLQCDGIVNAANSGLLGCFYPNHRCIDNAIHTYAGVQLRLACARLMNAQGQAEDAGKAEITPAFNLPSRYVLHTVGPIIRGHVTHQDCNLLASCYRSCLKSAEQNDLKSIAFCCISTGEFHFPNDKAAQIAIQTVKEFKLQTHSKIEVIFNVFKKLDYNIYKNLLCTD